MAFLIKRERQLVMCGIAGAINLKVDENLIHQSLTHRGPDEKGAFKKDNIQLLHTRLAIQDIASGQQPMSRGHLTVVFNGEIYNHQQLRESVLPGEYQTKSDVETLLALHDAYGPAGLNMVDGMFAFALYDHNRKKLTLCRDRSGKKPLYYIIHEKKLVFASELNTLAKMTPLKINETNINRFLRMGFFYQSETPYQGVKELPAGTVLEVNTNDLSKKQYGWVERNQSPSPIVTMDKAIFEVEHALEDAINNRFISSDIEVGTFLSGGIDSGLVTSILAKKTNRTIKTFTVKFDGTFDESKLASLVSQKYETDHTEIEVSFEGLFNKVQKILTYYGEPFADPSAIPSYLVSEEARKHVTVILNGDGADELFGGYRRYVPYATLAPFINSTSFKWAAKYLIKCIGMPKNKQSMKNYLHRLLSLSQFEKEAKYLASSTDIFEGVLNDSFIQPPSLDDTSFSCDILNATDIMNLDFQNILFSALLVKMDIASMANSLEGRSPFLSKRVIDTANRIGSHLKVNGKQTKIVLRELAKRYLPHELIFQPKRGFEIPLQQWVNGELHGPINDLLSPKAAYCKNFIKPEFISNLLANQQLPFSQEKRSKMLWTLMTLEVWHESLKAK